MLLLERESDLAALGASWARACSGAGGEMVVVRGEPGAGKTSVVQAFVESVPAATAVLWGACDPLTTPRPLGPLLDVADRLGEGTQAVLRDGGASHDLATSVLADLREQSYLLVVDDLHWADQGTVDLLRYLLRRIGSTRSLVVTTVRPDDLEPAHPVRALLGDVARSPAGQSLSLAPLSPDAVRALAADREVDLEQLHAVTGGNPFFVVELLGHDGEAMPATVRDAVLARTVDLDDDARAVLDLLVCAPEAIPDRALPRLGVSLPSLRALDRAGLIRRGARGVAFRHDLLRLALAEALPPGGEIALHRRMLDALETLDAVDPAVLVHHARGAHDPARILRYGSAAGRAAARAGAHTQAAEFFRLALDHGAVVAPEARADLMELLAAEYYLLDRLDDAIKEHREVLALRERLHDADGAGRAHLGLSVYEWYNANRPSSEQHALEACDVIGPAGDGELLGFALAMQAVLSVHQFDLGAAQALTAQARDNADAVSAPVLDTKLRWLEGVRGVAAGTPGSREQTLGVLEPRVTDFDEVVSSGFSHLVYLDVEQRRLAEAADVLDVSLPLTVEWDVPICNAWQTGVRSRLRLFSGEWSGADADVEHVLSTFEAPLARGWPLLVQGLLRLRRVGDDDGGLDDAWDLAVRYREPLRVLAASAALVERSWLTGREDARLADAVAALAEFDRPGLEWPRGELAGWLRRAGEDVAAGTSRLAEPYRLQLAGDDLGAARLFAAAGMPWDRALALLDSGRRDEARDGVDLLDRLGAEAVANRFRQLLRDRGVVVPSRRRESTRRNAAGLTARELDVLRLLDEGLSNAELAERLYISPKTADHHVSAILSKLQVPSRRHAPAAGRELGLLD